MRGARVLLTGGTGILGSWLLAEALQRGCAPVAIVRGGSVAQARERVRDALGIAGMADAAGAVEILLGDTREPRFGLDEAAWRALRGRIDAVVHCAASTSFSRRKDALIRATNVGAVEHAIGLIEGSGAPLHHVSTSYVAGTGKPVALEADLKPEPLCRNGYERSKADAERLIRAAHAEGRIRAAVFRPSIIVGASDSGRIAQFLNFYQVLRLIDLVRQGMFPHLPRVRIVVNPKAALNLVPVDWVARALWDIAAAEGGSGLTYHLTNPHPVSLDALAAWSRSFLGADAGGVEFVDRIDGPMEDTESVLNQMAEMFRGYVRDPEPHFDRCNTDRALAGRRPCPAADGALFERLLAFASASGWESPMGHRVRDILPETA